MSNFIKFLIYSLETLDGHRGSATTLINDKKKAIIRSQLGQESEDCCKRVFTELEIDQNVRHQVMMKTFTKYQIMRAKMKISYSALMKMETIAEHWLK